jgi:hypothetical protein
MMQIGRNLSDPVDGFLADKEFIILDRDSKYSAAFRDLLRGSGVEIVRPNRRSAEYLKGTRSAQPRPAEKDGKSCANREPGRSHDLPPAARVFRTRGLLFRTLLGCGRRCSGGSDVRECPSRGGAGSRQEKEPRMQTKELQEKLAKDMKAWQKIENASVASTGKVIEQTDHPIIRLVMEIIQSDSQMHHRVQQFIADSIEREPVTLTPEQMSTVWTGIEKHIDIEKKMVSNVAEALSMIGKRQMVVQEYLLSYLLEDEKKHDHLLEALEKIKKGMYPYG